MANLNTEVWLDELIEQTEPDGTFLTEAKNLDAHVDNDKIHLGEAGIDPEVLVNNTTYPIGIQTRPDNHYELVLDTYDTKNTIVRDIEAAELNYDKRQSVVKGHGRSLRKQFVKKGAHAFAPNSNTIHTPVIQATGPDNGKGVKSLLFEDIINFGLALTEAGYEEEGRILLLSAQHKADLKKQDLKMYKAIFSGKEKEYEDFKLYSLSSMYMPKFNRTNGTKEAFGAAAKASDVAGSIGFMKDMVGVCRGTAKMFATIASPTERGDIVGFQQRGLTLPLTGKGLGAIYSPSV